jgi:hypothetical protein
LECVKPRPLLNIFWVYLAGRPSSMEGKEPILG